MHKYLQLRLLLRGRRERSAMGGDLENENMNPLTSRCVTDADAEAPAHFATKGEKKEGLNSKHIEMQDHVF